MLVYAELGKIQINKLVMECGNYLGLVTEISAELSDVLEDGHVVLPAVAPEL